MRTVYSISRRVYPKPRHTLRQAYERRLSRRDLYGFRGCSLTGHRVRVATSLTKRGWGKTGALARAHDGRPIEVGHAKGILPVGRENLRERPAVTENGLYVGYALNYDSPVMERGHPAPRAPYPLERRRFVAMIGGGLVAAPLAAAAQQPGKTARVGQLLVGPAPSPEELARVTSTSPFWLAMKELGWVEGQNLVVERRFGESADQLRAAATDLVRLKVDVLFVSSASLAKMLQLETKIIPIVVGGAGGDLVAGGLVASLARPGGNLTGIQIRNDDLVPKKLEFLKALVPNLSRLAFLQEDVTLSGFPQMLALYDQ